MMAPFKVVPPSDFLFVIVIVGIAAAVEDLTRARESAHAFQQIAFQTIQSSAIVCFLHHKIQSFFDVTQQKR
jgi:hypothetical protein